MSGVALAPGETGIPRIVAAVRALILGRSNAVGLCTLTANAATTTVAAPNCSAESKVFLFPNTANAAAEFGNGTIRIARANVANGSFVITHANNAQTDRDFFYVCLG